MQKDELSLLKISSDGHSLVHQNGNFFFWLADTAWEMLHKLNREEIIFYLDQRASQGFTVILTVLLAELDGLRTPNAYGHRPLENFDPERPSDLYFGHVDWVIENAAKRGLYLAILPTWGDKVHQKYKWAKGPEIFNTNNANRYGRWLGERYRHTKSIIWILGGDRNPEPSAISIWNAMANGILEGYPIEEKPLMTFHPQPHDGGSSSVWFSQAPWLDFNMLQTGHQRDAPVYRFIQNDYYRIPVKPVLDGEPTYEAHPLDFNAAEKGYSTARDIRKLAYWEFFSGSLGYTYGCHSVWQFYDENSTGINYPIYDWKEALTLEGACQMKWLKNLVLSRPMTERVPDQSLIVGDNLEGSDYIVALRGRNGNYAMVYTPGGNSFYMDTSFCSNDNLSFFWYNPCDGTKSILRKTKKASKIFFQPPSLHTLHDWILVIDADI